ncbi:MAG TPA: hypothetical protein VFG65_04360 [Fimbriimonadales bacterium]|jgi:hypothetical protein|nr:hypothetical protein [Fimbriimonadales bacterium]
MTSQELIAYQCRDIGRQIEKATEGLDDSGWEYSSGTARSPRQTLAHLCECYHALKVVAGGDEYEWGTLSYEDLLLDEVKGKFAIMRSEAVSIATQASDDAMLEKASSFIVAHDAYHLGQLCRTRMEFDPNWNPYSIYEEG